MGGMWRVKERMMGDGWWADPGLPDCGGHCKFSGGKVQWEADRLL